MTKVVVVGAGAVGCYYGGMLARAGVPVTLIGRPSHVEAMRRDGLRLTTATSDERIPVEASTDIAAVAGADLVLVCVKSADSESTAAELAPHLAPSARILSLQNGVDNAARMQAVLQRAVGPTVVYVGCEMAGPGHVRHLGRGELVIPAELGAAPGLSATDVVALFARGNVPVQASDNVLGALWGKLVINCGYNAISAITDMNYGAMMARPDVAATVHGVVDECLTVAKALGITVEGDSHAGIDRIAATMPGQVSSTCQDLRRGKPTEIDHLNGFVVRQAEGQGIATPLNRALQALVKALESGRAGA
jgi:2-dehydropantoate 2-reductase